MRINTIVIASRLHKELNILLEKENLPYEFRLKRECDVTNEDLIWADAYVGFGPPTYIPLKHVKWVHSLGAGVDRFLQSTWDENIILTKTKVAFGEKISEYCLGYILRELQLHENLAQQQKKQRWHQKEPIPLHTQHIVIFGTGEIGQQIAKTLSFFRVNVIGVSRSGKKKAYFQDVVSMKERESVIEKADWIINTMPLTAETKGTFDESFFSKVNNCYFINVGRGASVVEEALIEAIQTKKVKKAILDVFLEEPLPVSSVLWEEENSVITPHISALTTAEEGFRCFLETLTKIKNDELLSNKIDIVKGY